MPTWILIAVFVTSQGVSSTSETFASETACFDARNFLQEIQSDRNIHSGVVVATVHATCVRDEYPVALFGE